MWSKTCLIACWNICLVKQTWWRCERIWRRKVYINIYGFEWNLEPQISSNHVAIFLFTQEKINLSLTLCLILKDLINIYAPTWYLTTFKKHVGPKRLFAVKSHDHHVMLQQILLTRVHDLLQPKPRTSIIRFGKTFDKICAKVINPSKFYDLHTYVVKTLCLLEVWFPLGLFDLMTHLVVHLVDEFKKCVGQWVLDGATKWKGILMYWINMSKIRFN